MSYILLELWLNMSESNLYNEQIEDRKRYTDLIINSTARNKIVVAGAGTGKSFTFQSYLTGKEGKSLALTFINNLARDLFNDLAGIAEVHTFHGYCKSVLHKISVDGITSSFRYYPQLPKLIESDALTLANQLSDLEKSIQTLTDGEEIEFYLRRANYYNSVGHNDSVYRVLKYFSLNPNAIPTFTQIVVDEYQDFNLLEVEFIESLALKSPVLIAGDDDQALYWFKNASADYIRKKATDGTYEKFELPFCSRCTEVIVSAIADIISKAKALGSLENRIDKKYICFMPEKELDSQKYPQIIHASCSIQNKQPARNYIGKYIENEIKKIPQSEIDLAKSKNYPCVLIVGQSQYLKQIHVYLKDKFTNIDFSENKDDEIDILDGYKILMEDINSNLGWRIIVEFSDTKFKEEIVEKTKLEDLILCDLLTDNFKEKHLDVVKVLKKILNSEEIADEETKLIKKSLALTIEEARTIFKQSADNEGEIIQDDQSVSIKLSTITSCKGMSAGFVFVVGMNNGNIPRNPTNPTDNEVCQFIVALTRTRKKCYLISNRRFGITYGIRPSVFIQWINSEKIDNVVVDAAYFRNLG